MWRLGRCPVAPSITVCSEITRCQLWSNRIADRSGLTCREAASSNMTMHFVAFSKKPFDIDGWKSIEPLHIGIVRGWKILEDNTRDFPHVTLVPTEIELFTMLEKDRIDVALYSMLTGYEQLNKRRFEGIQHLEPPLASRDMFLYLHKSRADLVQPVAEALRAMKQDGTYERIVTETTSHLTMGVE